MQHQRPYKQAGLWAVAFIASISVLEAVTVPGCGNSALLFLNPALVNQTQGGLFPLTPGPETGSLLIRVVNTTSETLTFIVTAERAQGDVASTETHDLFTVPGRFTGESGYLFECTPDNPILRIGLGENLNAPTTETGLFVGAAGAIDQGFGVPSNINPLSATEGDFRCGDTIIFQAIESANTTGGFRVQPFLLSDAGQPDVSVFNTFQVAVDFLRESAFE